MLFAHEAGRWVKMRRGARAMCRGCVTLQGDGTGSRALFPRFLGGVRAARVSTSYPLRRRPPVFHEENMVTRREALANTAAAIAGGAVVLGQTRSAQAGQGDTTGQGWNKSYSGGSPDVRPQPPGEPGRDYAPTITPNGATLPFKVVDGVKVFHLTAEEVSHEFAPGLKATCWGYNGRVHGPTIEAVEGERVRIYVTNRLTAPTTIHWHGLFVPNGMD